MQSYVVRTPEQLIPIFSAFRRRNGLSQAELARLIGVSQQTVSQLERNPDKATLERLLRAFAAMDVEIVVRTKGTSAETGVPSSAEKANW
jgi:HTH-type transcriptional regulator / antitoxin HipB